ncbi:MAG: family 78 glycoside hydrolase catalytic domain [Oscillospiraceae bacterium]|nr:family 78 glycoside hydrolase catalytic domain [Oscillospiraceae bacterium]
MKAINLYTEYLKNPLGIDITEPRLFWNCEGGIRQSAYQLVAEVNGSPAWDSGKVESSSMRCEWGGQRLGSRDRVSWRVRLWDENGMPGEWTEAGFEMGLLRKSDWQARWITGNYTPKTRRNILRPYTGGKAERYPVDCFRKVFTAGEISKARLYITACGLYEARINGERVGAFVMAPGYTDYRKRVQYQTYDVTALLRRGENVLSVQLADGWYRGSVGAWGCLCEYGYETKLLAQLELTDAEGRSACICTDGTWQWSDDGPIRFADNKDGELFDARMEPGYSGKAKLTSHKVLPTASNNVPVTEHETFKPTVITTPSGKTVLDFGQNIAGYVAFELTARAGQRVFLRFGELMDKNGEFTQKNIQVSRKGHTSPLQQVEYICREGLNTYKTAFAVFGFRYVLLETDTAWQPGAFTAVAVYSDMERTGFFDSSNELLNKFVENTLWSAKNNFLDIPTDCPTRERHGWTGDAQIFYMTSAYLLDCTAFWRKYLLDVYDWQKKDGRLPQIAPCGGTDFFMATMNGSVGWSDVGIFTPYRMWKLTGDRSILLRHYEGMRAFAEFEISRCGPRFDIYSVYAKRVHMARADKKYLVNSGQSYGEWAEPADVHPNDWKDIVAPHPEVSTAYTSYVLGLMAEIAEELGKRADAERFSEYAKNCREAYISLRRTKEYPLETKRQAELVRPLYMELFDEEDRKEAEKKLIRLLEDYGWRLGTGFLSTPLILYVLADIDIEAAYRLLENEEMPGWLYMPKNGATTIWESWEGTEAQGGIASLNHYSKGSCVEWLFEGMCGIRTAGENRFIIAPRPGGTFTRAAAEYRSIYGRVKSSWSRENGALRYSVTVPANCTAALRLPDGREEELTAGEYVF